MYEPSEEEGGDHGVRTRPPPPIHDADSEAHNHPTMLGPPAGSPRKLPHTRTVVPVNEALVLWQNRNEAPEVARTLEEYLHRPEKRALAGAPAWAMGHSAGEKADHWPPRELCARCRVRQGCLEVACLGR
jgi:hypothetical protein